MTKATYSKATRRPTCQNPTCKKRFTTSVASAKYCSAKCGDAKRNTRKKVDPLDKAAKSAFFMYLASECLRAGTIEILRGHNVESLCELHSLYVANMKWNGFGDFSAYELSHIAPVKGHDYIGMLYAENLVSAPKSLNRAHGTKHYGHGKAINRLTLNHKLNVDKRWNSVSEVRQMVINYLGRELVCSVIKACKIKPTQRHQVTEWILAHYDPLNPTHRTALPDLDQVHNLKARELAHVKAAMLDEDAGDYISTPPTHPAIVLTQELSRLSLYRPELEVYAYALGEALNTQDDGYSLFSKHHEKMLFDVLHGKSIAVMADTLEMIVGENTAHTFIRYTGNDDSALRYNVDAFKFVAKPSGGATLHKTSLAAFKASISVRGARKIEQSFSFPSHEVVLDPWVNEVVAPF